MEIPLCKLPRRLAEKQVSWKEKKKDIRSSRVDSGLYIMIESLSRE